MHEVAEHETHKRNVTKIRSKMANNAHIPVKKYETLLEEEESANTYMDDADNTRQKDMTKPYEPTDVAQHLLMHGQSIPRAFFINKALHEVYTIQRGVANSIIDPTSSNIEMKNKEETKRGCDITHVLFPEHCVPLLSSHWEIVTS